MNVPTTTTTGILSTGRKGAGCDLHEFRWLGMRYRTEPWPLLPWSTREGLRWIMGGGAWWLAGKGGREGGGRGSVSSQGPARGDVVAVGRTRFT